MSRYLVVALLLVGGAAHAEPLELHPTLLLEVDARVYPREQEGLTGFALARLRPGVELRASSWLSAFTQLELAGEHAEVQDAFLRATPLPELTLTLGFSKAPLFPSHREPVQLLAMPEVTPVAQAFRVSRDLGLGLVWSPAQPVEIFARVGNGSSSFAGNDNLELAYYLGADLVLGAAHRLQRDAPYALRVGATALYESAEDRAGIRGRTLLGFGYFRPPTVSGDRLVGEAHVDAKLGVMRLRVEAALADESRSRDDDGNPSTPRVAQDTSRSSGLSVEVGAHLCQVDVTAQLSRLWLARATEDLDGGGAVEGALALKWWPTDYLALTAAASYARYDRSPIEEPGEDDGFNVLLRASVFGGL